MILDLKKIVKKYNIKIKGVIHIGAHLGQEYSIYNKMNISNMVFFEPQKDIFNQLSMHVQQSENIKLYNIALGNQTGTIKMYVDSYKQQSSSLLKPKKHLNQYPHIQFNDECYVKIDKLDNIIKSREYNFISMDVQGFELEVLRGGTSVLKHIDYIQTEVNRDELYQDCVQVGQLDEFLTQYDFIRVITNWKGKNWGDAFYIKKVKLPMNSEKSGITKIIFNKLNNIFKKNYSL